MGCWLTAGGLPSHSVPFSPLVAKFLTNYLKSCNSLCVMFANVAQNELKDLPSGTTAPT